MAEKLNHVPNAVPSGETWSAAISAVIAILELMFQRLKAAKFAKYLESAMYEDGRVLGVCIIEAMQSVPSVTAD